ncbi:fibronectin type III domain-containing protein [Chloroflexota bacterium]
MNKPVKISHFLLLVGLMVVIASLAAMHPPAAGDDNTSPPNRPGDSTPLEDKALALLSAVMADYAEDGYLLPPGTEVIAVTIEGDRIIIDLRLPGDFVEEQLNAIHSDAINKLIVDTLLPLGLRRFHVRAEDDGGQFIPLSDFLPAAPMKVQMLPENLDPLPPRLGPLPDAPLAPPQSGQGQPVGALSGKTVWLSAGHGWVWTGVRWATQRPNVYGIVEDFSNAEAINYYLARYLWNSGADVWLVRERSMNKNEIIIDNDDGAPGYLENGEFITSVSNGYNGGEYRYAVSEATLSASATWTPSITEPGWYPIWVWYRHSANRPVDTRYQIHHSGGVTAVSISQEVHGKTWRYLGDYYFETGTGGYVTLTNESSDPGQAVIADAIRFGGGMGSIDRGLGVSGEPRWEEASRYYAEFQGYPVDSSTNDVIVRPLYAEWEKSSGYPDEDGVFISWHTNCCDKSGTLSFIHSFEPTAGSGALRAHVHNELIQDLRGAWNPEWQDRGQLTADFGEVRELSTMPGVLLEVAYHDTESPGDADDLKEPLFRQISARAVYQGITKYFAYKDDNPVQLLPEPPTHLIVRNTAAGQVTLNWRPPHSGGVVGDAAVGYKVYQSTNGRGFDNGMLTSDTHLTVNGLRSGELYFFRVTALNKGGESFPTPVVAVRTPQSGIDVPFLIVDGFERLDKQAMIPQEEGGSLGTPMRMFLERMNRFDYTIEHAQALHGCGFSFDGALNEAVEGGDITIGNYPALDWFVGEDATVEEALSSTERSLLAEYLDEAGNLLISGSEIGHQLARPSSGEDPAFYNQYLKTEYVGNDASTYNFSAASGDFFDGISGSFDDSTQGYYNVDSPDRLSSSGGSLVVMNYNGGTNDGAAIAFEGDYRLVYFGFPLEATIDPQTRKTLICKSAEFLLGPVSHELYLPLIFSNRR